MVVDGWRCLADASDLLSLRDLLSGFPTSTVFSIAERAFLEVIGANFVGCNASSPLPFVTIFIRTRCLELKCFDPQ
ncbi:hypothetical protein KIN20_027486 [Parelaphostrongylus tenuis]|uniref:Uncharacterized protein n=1 Tax=Parelaphostrongylus tenuis TaxID=148309 RepID=A0AAD5QZM4_PARTN|nr:hypothetical protein KIN20_027486 [Parelaphostrongylus tenuis]